MDDAAALVNLQFKKRRNWFLLIICRCSTVASFTTSTSSVPEDSKQKAKWQKNLTGTNQWVL